MLSKLNNPEIYSERTKDKEPVIPNTIKTTISWYVEDTLNKFFSLSINIIRFIVSYLISGGRRITLDPVASVFIEHGVRKFSINHTVTQ